MKIPFNQYKRLSLVPLAGLALAAYCLFVQARLSRRAQELDAPLHREWQALCLSLDQSNATTVDFSHITNQLAETRRDLLLLQEARKKALARLELPTAVRDHLNAPFQLVEFENERGKDMDDLARLARQKQVTIDPAVFDGFPEHTADLREPVLLWPALALANGLLTTALQCQVSAIHFLEAPLSPTNAPGRVTAIPLQVELTGPASAINQLLQVLPLRADELRAAGLPEMPVEKPPLFVDRLVIRRQSPDKPDETRIWLRALGFVLQE